MSNPITIKATRGVWLSTHNNLSDVAHYLEQGKTDLALGLLSIVGPASWETFSDYIRVGDAEVTFTLLPRDEQAAMAVMHLRAKLDKLREAYAEAQREILAQISKYEALTNGGGRVTDDDEICPACNGSGEGQYDGTRCRSCGGSGTERTERDEPDWDALRKERMELAAVWADRNGDV